MHLYIFVHICIYICIYENIYIYLCTYLYIYLYIYIYVYKYIRIHMYVNTVSNRIVVGLQPSLHHNPHGYFYGDFSKIKSVTQYPEQCPIKWRNYSYYKSVQ